MVKAWKNFFICHTLKRVGLRQSQWHVAHAPSTPNERHHCQQKSISGKESRSQNIIFLLISFGCFFYFIPMFSLHPPSKKGKMIWSRCELCARWMAFWEIFFDNKKQSLWKTKSWTIKKRKQTTRLDFVGGKAAKCLEIFTLFTQCDPMETDKSEIQCYKGRVVLLVLDASWNS